jgi:CRISPR-associated protein Csb2
MPWYKKGPTDRTLVFDAFVALDPREGGGAVRAIWPDAELNDAQRGLLARLLANLNFLGRAESWCHARLLSEGEANAALEDGDLIHVKPLNDAFDQRSCLDLELVRTLCADPNSAFADTHVVETKTTTQGRGKNKTTTVSRQPVYDPNWHLCMETLRLHAQKWSDPPGSRWVTYVRPRNCFEIKPVPRKAPARRAANTPPVHVARFVLDSSVLPLVTDTLPLAEAVRRALMSIYGHLTRTGNARGQSAIFAGKDEHGTPLRGHRHAYFLPTDEDGDGRLDHLTICAADGFGPDELRALRCLTSISRNSPHPIRVLLLGTVSTEHVAPGFGHTPPLLACSKVWVSATPYLVTRHPKTRGPRKLSVADPAARLRFLQDNLIDQLQKLRESRRDPSGLVLDPQTVEPLRDDGGRFIISTATGPSRRLRPLQFKRFRGKRTDDGGRRLAGAFRITFPNPVQGPLALGHSSHFGMGLFLPADDTVPVLTSDVHG